MRKLRFLLTVITVVAVLGLTSGCRKPKSAGDDALNPDVTGIDDGQIPDATPWGQGGEFDGSPLGSRPDLGTEFVPADLNIQNVLFGYDSSNVEPSERYKVEIVGDYLVNNPEVSLVVEGHADERGSSDYNLALSERRALAIRDYLVQLGAGAARLTTSPMGEEYPVSFGHDEQSWQVNRRGEFKFYK